MFACVILECENRNNQTEEKSEGIPELFQRFGHEAVIVSTMRAAEPSDMAPLIMWNDLKR